MSQFEPLNPEDTPPTAGPYSHAVRVGDMVYISGQIPCDSEGRLVEGDFSRQVKQLLFNLHQVIRMSGGDMNEIVKLTVYLTDFAHYDILNQEMTLALAEPYPARMVIGVNALPKGASVAADAILYISQA